MQRTICSSISSTKASSSADDWGGLSPLVASSPIVVVDVGAMVASFCDCGKIVFGSLFFSFCLIHELAPFSVLLPGQPNKSKTRQRFSASGSSALSFWELRLLRT
jgi:hypothetical protein